MSAHHDTHGSPRGDTECVTVATPETRVRAFMPDRTDYDLSETIAAYRQTNDPTLEQMVEMLEQPPTPDELIAHAEKIVFSD